MLWASSNQRVRAPHLGFGINIISAGGKTLDLAPTRMTLWIFSERILFARSIISRWRKMLYAFWQIIVIYDLFKYIMHCLNDNLFKEFIKPDFPSCLKSGD